ncbi:transposase [Bifidobacterium longum]|nr:transposase [Bifidobacterium longum]MDB6581916.1 transposase [Bifidobacterium longum]MDB6583873.1 transposase [Bifidobacterium longum]
MSVANQKTVSGFLHVAWRTAGDIARRVADRLKASMPSPFDGLTLIGVDEASYRKGHTYITVVVDHERHRVIWARDGYGGDVFGLFFQALTPEQRTSIRVVTGDGARRIDSCVDQWRPNAERVLDEFHIWIGNARLEASDNRIKVIIRMAYGFHHVDNLIAPQERSNIPIEHCDTAMSLLKELSVAFNAFL